MNKLNRILSGLGLSLTLLGASVAHAGNITGAGATFT